MCEFPSRTFGLTQKAHLRRDDVPLLAQLSHLRVTLSVLLVYFFVRGSTANLGIEPADSGSGQAGSQLWGTWLCGVRLCGAVVGACQHVTPQANGTHSWNVLLKLVSVASSKSISRVDLQPILQGAHTWCIVPHFIFTTTLKGRV